MTRIGQRFDTWVRSGPFTARDLGLFRIVFAVTALLTMPRATSTNGLTPAWWAPAPGPFELLGGPPPDAVVVVLQVALAVSLALLAVGVWTTAVSVSSGLLLLVSDGVLNGYGTLHHYGLLAVVPLVVCWAGWGRRFSVDARRHVRRDAQIAQWPLRLLALLIGIGFVTAGWPKVLGGWLSTDSQATQGFVYSYYLRDPHPPGWLVDLVGVQARRPWELVDWITVALELSVVVSVLSWTWFRRTLVVLVAFHLGILLLLGIAFASNVIAYGAFASWSLLVPERSVRITRSIPPLVVAGAVIALSGVGLPVSLAISPEQRLTLSSTWVVLGALVCAALAVRRLRRAG